MMSRDHLSVPRPLGSKRLPPRPPTLIHASTVGTLQVPRTELSNNGVTPALPACASLDPPGNPTLGTNRANRRPRSLSKEKVPQLKERLRERGLPVSGNKTVLVERLLGAIKSGLKASSRPPGPTLSGPPAAEGFLADSPAVVPGSRGAHEQHELATSNHEANHWRAIPGAGQHGPGGEEELARERTRWQVQNALVDMISALFTKEDGGTREVVFSRSVGRALSELPAPDGSGQSALTCLKGRWPSLRAFLKSCPTHFELVDGDQSGDGIEFGVIMARAEGSGGAGQEDPERRHPGARSVAATAAARGSRNSR